MNKTRIDTIRTRLDERERELAKRRRTALEAENALLEPELLDSEDRATNQPAARYYDAISEAELREIRELQAARARLDAGTYGTCTSCGQSIDPRRLELLPAVDRCTECAR